MYRARQIGDGGYIAVVARALRGGGYACCCRHAAAPARRRPRRPTSKRFAPPPPPRRNFRRVRNPRHGLWRKFAKRRVSDRSERVHFAAAGRHGQGSGSNPERSGAGTRSQPSQRLLEGPKSHRLDPRIPPVLHPGRGRKAGLLPVFERFERHERHRDRRRHDIPGKPVDRIDPAPRQRRDACL